MMKHFAASVVCVVCAVCTVALAVVGGCKGKSKTAARDAAPNVSPALATPNAKAVTLLLDSLKQRYSHRDYTGVNWEAVFAGKRAALEAAPNAAHFGKQLVKILAIAKDTHISVTVDGAAPMPTFAPPLVFNVDLSIIAERVEGIRDIDPCVAVGMLDKKTGYLLVKTFSRAMCQRFGASLNKAFDEILALPRMVIDVRPNTGGDEKLARLIAARFIKGDVIYAQTELGPPRNTTTKFPRRIMGARSEQRFKGDVRLLIGGGNLSSTEAFILMMKMAPKAKLIGAKTYGSSGNPKPIILGNGVRVSLPSWRSFTPEGKPIEGVGINPDVEVEWPVATKIDTVLDAALASF